MDNRVGGILASISKSTRQFDHFTALVSDGIPLFFFDRPCTKLATDRVIIDDFEGAFMLCEHLIEQGCRSILHLGTLRHMHTGIKRYEGYAAALQKHSIPFRKERALVCDTRESVLRQRSGLLKLAPEIDGIFAVNDSTAITVMQILQGAGYRVPGQIAVAGFGDGPDTIVTQPALTTVDQQGYEMGNEAVRLLIRRIENPVAAIPFTTRVLRPVLRVRGSTCRH